MGSRTFHNKSRNGCSRCKQRRVKCNLQAPRCSNCHRRGEGCEYQNWSPVLTELNQDPGNAPTNPEGALVPMVSSPSHRRHDLLMTSSSFDLIMRSCMPEILWSCRISESELDIWNQALTRQGPGFPYLQHGLTSLLLLYNEARHSLNNRSLAYQHHLAASKLFREFSPIVNQENWFAILIFGISVLIFHFATQQTCSEDVFDFIETLRVLRMSTDLAFGVSPFLFRSALWPFIQRRVYRPLEPFDARAEAALVDLETIVRSSFIVSSDQGVRIDALDGFKDWAIECNGYPRTWLHYIHWPGIVPEEFLVLLSQEDDIALLILIHWCAFLYLGAKRWFLEHWPLRTAVSAMSKLSGDWEKTLAWPTAVFASQLAQP